MSWLLRFGGGCMAVKDKQTDVELFGADAVSCYHGALDHLHKSGISFLLGGAFAFRHYTGITRHTKDLDVFLKRSDLDAALAVLKAAGYQTELTYLHWLAKAYSGKYYLDLIFNLGNGIAPVDDDWFRNAPKITVFDVPVLACPVEEMIRSKAFTMERDRYDGADIAHLIRACGDRIDWPLLVQKFGEHWPVLLGHVIHFGYIYPAEVNQVPVEVRLELLRRQQESWTKTPENGKLCRGALLGGIQYLVDLEQWGYQDGRVRPYGNITAEEAAQWKEARLAGK